MSTFLKKNTFFMISIGAIPGAIVRWQMDEIFIVNLIGCFLLGFFNSLSYAKRFKLILGIGFCGSLTTFTGWVFHLNNLLAQGLFRLFFIHSIFSVVIGIFAVGLGHIFAKKINP